MGNIIVFKLCHQNLNLISTRLNFFLYFADLNNEHQTENETFVV